MKKVTSLKRLLHSPLKDCKKLQFAAQLTQASDSQHQNLNFWEDRIHPLLSPHKAQGQRLYSRTNSVSDLKLNSNFLLFEILGVNIILDSMAKDQAEQKLHQCLSILKVSQLKKTQIKLVVFERLLEKNQDFYDSVQNVIEQYAIAQFRKIQENKINLDASLN